MNPNTLKISVVELLSLLPDERLNKITKKTKVDYYVKVLDGKSVFYLILYSLIECQRNSLRTMEDIFNSPSFKFLFNLDTEKTVKFNSISERLAKISIEFFKEAYELIFEFYSKHFSIEEIERHKLIRVDSTMVAEAANKLKQGMGGGKKKDGKKQVKFTMAYDGNFPCMSEIFTDKQYSSEDLTIPRIVYQFAKQNKNSVFTFDRGVHKRETYCKLHKDATPFVTRVKKNPGTKL